MRAVSPLGAARFINPSRVLAPAACCAAAGVAGAAAVSRPEPVLFAVAATFLVGVAAQSVTPLVISAFLALAYLPESLVKAGPLDRPELQKGFILFALLALAAVRGVRWSFLLPVGAYALLALLAIVNGQLNPQLTSTQMLSSFVTLTLAWIALSIRWEWSRDVKFLKVLAWVPVVSVALGVVLQALGIHDLWKEAQAGESIGRLRGALIPAQLGMCALMGCVTAYICFRETKWQFGRVLVAANAGILALTVTRGAALALIIACVWPAIRYGFGALEAPLRVVYARVVVLVALGAIVAIALLPVFEARNSGGLYTAQDAPADSTSGRKEAWRETYAIAEQSPLFGHGLGAGPVTHIQQEGFLAQHNEYLRLFLEGGYLGGGLVLASILLAIALAIRRAPRHLRLDLTGVALGYAVLSYTDNTLNAPSMAVAFAVLLGICASQTTGSSRSEALAAR